MERNNDIVGVPHPPDYGRLRAMVSRIRSLQDGDLAVLDALAIGNDAIPLLRQLLFDREPAGIFQPRQRAIQALVGLDAFDVLRDYIAKWRPAPDPVERLGDEVVVGMAANALAAHGDYDGFALVLAVARRHPTPGVIEALGTYQRAEVIPILIEALLDDCAAGPAREGLRAFGQMAVPALVDVAVNAIVGPSGRETPSSIRRRRHALSLLIDLGANCESNIRIRSLSYDSDDEIASLACRMGIASAYTAWSRECARRLIELLRQAAWPIRGEIEDSLIANAAVAGNLVERALRRATESPSPDPPAVRFVTSLRRVLLAISSAREPSA